MEKPIAFVVMSFAPEHRGVYEYVIKRTFEKDLGWVCWRVDERPGAGNLVRQIVEGIARATLVVADLTALEPRVLYELGVAHTLGVPVLTLYQPGSEDKMPFQLRSYRSIEYENTAAGAAELCEALSEAVATLPEWGAQPSNPVQDFLPVERRGGPTISAVPLPATPADEASLRELAYAREQASMVRRRLHLLQIQQARQGGTTDPSVLIEIEDLSEQLEALRREIARLEGGR
jgi:hypothetical protein